MGETSSSDVTLILKGLKVFTGQKPEEFADWLRKFSLLLSFRRRDMYDIIEGQQRPTADTNTLTTEQAAFDQANKDLYAILFLTTEKPAALLVTKHATDSRGTCGDGQAAMKELESKYLKVTNEYIRATQKALANTEMHLGQDPDEYINEATVLRERLTEMKEPISDRHFMDIILEGLTDTYKDVKLMTWKDPDIDLSKIQSVLRHVYQDEQSRKTDRGVAGRGFAMAAKGLEKTIICHNCGIAGHYEKGCAMPRTGNKTRHASKREHKQEEGKKWCSFHNTTSHSNEECYSQRDKQTSAKTNVSIAEGEKPVLDFSNYDVVEEDGWGLCF